MSAILVVDDNPLNANLARIVLSRGGHDVIVVECAAEAVAAIERHVPDVVVTDINMPGTSGVDLCRGLRERYPRHALRIVAYTALAMQDELVRIRAAGFDAVVVKPASKESLLAAVRYDGPPSGS